jgi:7,8-dihydropterin-6-yl-methyl-4-(beta-D-ribofuranosyl)aminobenzene 5'-phosphate synthase
MICKIIHGIFIFLIIFSVNILYVNSHQKDNTMKIHVLYDNTAIDGFKSGWGFSCLVNDSVLFDAGADPEVLKSNFENFGLSKKDIKIIFISHYHSDHVEGLKYFSDLTRNKIKLYCTNDSKEIIENLITNIEFRILQKHDCITDNLYSSGIIIGNYNGRVIQEQSLIIYKNKKLGIITGCSHPGILNIVKNIIHSFPGMEISFLIGGFHFVGFGRTKVTEICNELKRLGVKKAGPSHCSGKIGKEVFRVIYNQDFIEVDAGRIIDIDKLFK